MHMAAVQVSLVVLLQQHGPDQAHDGPVVGEDAEEPMRSKSRFTEEQMVAIVREADRTSVAEAARKNNVCCRSRCVCCWDRAARTGHPGAAGGAARGLAPSAGWRPAQSR